jgi:hypothetical protein
MKSYFLFGHHTFFLTFINYLLLTAFMRRYKKKNRERINQIIIGLFLVFLMVFSIVGYIASYRDPAFQGRQVYEFNGVEYDVDVNNNILATELDGEQVIFYNYPDSVSPIPEQAITDLFAANAPGPLFTFDPNVGEFIVVIDLVRSELDDLFLQRNTFLSHGIHEGTTGAYQNFPQLDCVNSSQGSPVIKFINSSEISITYEDYCLVLGASGPDTLELRDSLMYSLYGLI